MYQLAGRHFCASHLSSRTRDAEIAHSVGQSVMLDNGAFTVWKSGRTPNWPAFYEWCAPWLDFPTTWAIPPDVIDAPSQEQDALLNEWPHGKRQAGPVWHMDEPISRLCRLVDDGWSRVCVGSTAEYAVVLAPAWCRRMDEAWNELAAVFQRTPAIHMLRGMQCSGREWPFASVDSSDIARNYNRPQNSPRAMADRWDAVQCPARWTIRIPQQELAL